MKRPVFAFCLLILVLQTEAGRGRVSGGRRTTPRSNHNRYTHGPTTQRNRYTTESRYGHSNAYDTGNSYPAASAPLNPGNNRPDIGFENVHNRLPNQSPGNQPPVGFNVPPPNHNQPSYHPPNYQNPGSYNPPNYQNPGGYNPHSPPNYHNPGNNNPYSPGGHPNYYSQGSFQGGYNGNPHIAQPGSYYNPQFATPPAGFSPPIYQPVQQSSGVGSVLGIAGSFAGGYLIGKLTSGGHSSSGDSYEVHHYHNNPNEVPKKLTVSDSGLSTCSQNETQNMCIPNTFPICLVNGTIMCVTHAAYLVPCGSNSSLSCVISTLPCAKDTANCTSSGNLTTTVVYVPCISNVTVSKSKKSDKADETSTKFCVTAVAEPKMPELSAIGSYLAMVANLAVAPLINETSTASPTAVNSTIGSNSTFNNTNPANSRIGLSNSTMAAVSSTTQLFNSTTITPANNTLESTNSTLDTNSTTLATTTPLPVTNHTEIVYVTS